ncbi:hypothetical protein U9M48_019437 [Paspalum notatum var. saurae]|uniref:USP8 dimerisation domain-containing protein n=1 Tax=Paspalum notatum var. saurae TaxID=547442 RepID=A0AAQ3TCM8_PASNO
MASRPPHRARIGVSIETLAHPVAVDHRISIHYYFRIADNLLRQANIYRNEKNLLDLYIILLRYTSLLLETIPKHRDYNSFKAKEKEFLKKGPHNSEKLLDVVNELESLKPVVQQQQFGNHDSMGAEEPDDVYGTYASSSGMEHHSPGPYYMSKSLAGSPSLQKSLSGSKHQSAPSQSVQPDRNTIKLWIAKLLVTSCLKSAVQHADVNTGSRSFCSLYRSIAYLKRKIASMVDVLSMNPNWFMIEYPRNPELTQSDISSLVPAIMNQDGLHGPTTALQEKNDDMLCVLSLDDGRWSLPIEQPASGPSGWEAEFSHLNIRQPSPPPVLAQVHPERGPIPPSRVTDPRPGLATSETECYQNLHVPVALMDCFLRVAEANTAINLETCGILAGTLKKRTFYVTTLIIPKQKSTSDSVSYLTLLHALVPLLL